MSSAAHLGRSPAAAGGSLRRTQMGRESRQPVEDLWSGREPRHGPEDVRQSGRVSHRYAKRCHPRLGQSPRSRAGRESQARWAPRGPPPPWARFPSRPVVCWLLRPSKWSSRIRRLLSCQGRHAPVLNDQRRGSSPPGHPVIRVVVVIGTGCQANLRQLKFGRTVCVAAPPGRRQEAGAAGGGIAATLDPEYLGIRAGRPGQVPRAVAGGEAGLEELAVQPRCPSLPREPTANHRRRALPPK
jgi:hypothetical protein